MGLPFLIGVLLKTLGGPLLHGLTSAHILIEKSHAHSNQNHTGPRNHDISGRTDHPMTQDKGGDKDP
jgi:hypothetical protein